MPLFTSTRYRTLPIADARRLIIRFRGFGFRERDISQVSAEDLTRIDICWAGACLELDQDGNQRDGVRVNVRGRCAARARKDRARRGEE